MNSVLAGLTILVLGDSHMVTSGYLISTLHDSLLEQGATVDTYGMCGANAARAPSMQRVVRPAQSAARGHSPAAAVDLADPPAMPLGETMP